MTQSGSSFGPIVHAVFETESAGYALSPMVMERDLRIRNQIQMPESARNEIDNFREIF